MLLEIADGFIAKTIMSILERWKHTRPLVLPTDDLVAMAIEIFSSHPKIEIAYLFGSRINENANAHSDIDFAFHATGDFQWDDYYFVRGELSKSFHSDRFDVLWLDKAPADIVFDVIKYGRVIVYRNDDVLNNFELYAKKRFWEFKIYLNNRRKQQ